MKLQELFEQTCTNMSETEMLNIINQKSSNIKQLIKLKCNIPHNVMLAAVQRNTHALNHMLKAKIVIPEDVLIAAAKHNYNSITGLIDFGYKLTLPIQLAAVTSGAKDTWVLQSLQNMLHYPPSEEVQLAAANHDAMQILGWTMSIHELSPKVVTTMLTNERFIKKHKEDYNSFVKNWFIGNDIMVNKWLRYGKNMRELG